MSIENLTTRNHDAIQLETSEVYINTSIRNADGDGLVERSSPNRKPYPAEEHMVFLKAEKVQSVRETTRANDEMGHGIR